MSNDNKLEVSRDLLAVIETFISTQADSFPKINVPRGMRSAGLDHISKELCALLATPVVECQPVAVKDSQFYDLRPGCGFSSVDWARLQELPIGTKLYTAPPEHAELQATIAQPQSERKPFGWWRVPKDFPLQGAFFSYVEGESERDVENAINHEFGFNVKWLYDEPVAQHPQPAERLTIAETRNAELVKLLREHANHVATLADALFRSGACMAAREFSDKAYAALEHQQIVNAFLKSTESGANNE